MYVFFQKTLRRKSLGHRENREVKKDSQMFLFRSQEFALISFKKQQQQNPKAMMNLLCPLSLVPPPPSFPPTLLLLDTISSKWNKQGKWCLGGFHKHWRADHHECAGNTGCTRCPGVHAYWTWQVEELGVKEGTILVAASEMEHTVFGWSGLSHLNMAGWDSSTESPWVLYQDTVIFLLLLSPPSGKIVPFLHALPCHRPFSNTRKWLVLPLVFFSPYHATKDWLLFYLLFIQSEAVWQGGWPISVDQ